MKIIFRALITFSLRWKITWREFNPYQIDRQASFFETCTTFVLSFFISFSQNLMFCRWKKKINQMSITLKRDIKTRIGHQDAIVFLMLLRQCYVEFILSLTLLYSSGCFFFLLNPYEETFIIDRQICCANNINNAGEIIRLFEKELEIFLFTSFFIIKSSDLLLPFGFMHELKQ